MVHTIFSTDNLQFNTDGSLSIDFYGIKNDTDRAGFTVTIQSASEAAIDHVRTLKCYINMTQEQRTGVSSNPVFLTLKKPYKAIDSSTVYNALQSESTRVGLESQRFRAKDFRPTGAT